MQPNIIMQTLMTQLQRKNPQGFQMVQNLMQNNGDPSSLIKQILGNATPEQRQNLLTQAKQYGVPDNILSAIQNM